MNQELPTRPEMKAQGVSWISPLVIAFKKNAKSLGNKGIGIMKMTKLKLGLILILLGFFVPSILLLFASDYRPGANLVQNAQTMRLVG